VRSSWEASETKRLILRSEVWRASKDCSTWVSIELRERAREPTSVVGGWGVTRLVRSPAAILPAVDSMERSGRGGRGTGEGAPPPPTRGRIEPATAKYEAVVRRVCWTSDRGRAIVMYPEKKPESWS